MTSGHNPSLDEKQVIDRFLDTIWTEKGLAEATLEAYRSDLLYFQKKMKEHGVTLVNATTADISQFMASCIEEGAALASVARKLSSLRRFYGFLLNKAVIIQSPTARIPPPKRKTGIPEVLTRNEIERLLAVPKTNKAIGFRDRTMLELLCATGMRVTELITMKVGQIDLAKKEVRLLGKGSHNRVLPLNESAVDWIKRFIQRKGPRDEILLERTSNYLFTTGRGEKMTRQAFWHRFKRHLKKAGIKKNASPHTLRHSFAVHALHNGARMWQVQRLLGHSVEQTTMRYRDYKASLRTGPPSLATLALPQRGR